MEHVSTFNNFTTPLEKLPIATVLNRIKSGKYKAEIHQIRIAKAEGREEEASQLKRKLPAFTPSAVYTNRRKSDSLETYTKLIILDIDKLERDTLYHCIQKTNDDAHTLASFISPSGTGLKIIARVDTDKELHKKAFLQVQAYYENLLEIEVDKSGKDISRLCYYSYDPHLYYNPVSISFNINPTDIQMEMRENKAYDKLYLGAVRFTLNREQYIEGNRNNFVYQLACNCNRKGIPQNLAESFILTDYDYNSDEVYAAIKSAYQNSNEYASDKFKKKESKSNTGEKETKHRQTNVQILDKLETYLLNKYKFRFNIISQKIEWKPSADRPFQPMNDFQENSILRDLLKNGINCSQSLLRFILKSDFCRVYNPFEEYFYALPEHDGEEYINQLADTITTSDQELWRVCFKKWLVAMVACSLHEDAINHTVIVFTGKQGLGKTTWIEALLPEQLRCYLFSGTINPNNKDTLIHLSECMLINLDELENLNKSEIGALKELITKSNIRMRRAYGHHAESMPRRASFAGSVNSAQFLNDSTGSRRFLCFEVDNIEYQHQIDIDKVMAQALSLFTEGYQYWFDRNEILQINLNNESYEIRSLEEELLLSNFEPCEKEEASFNISTSELASKISFANGINVNNGTIRRLGLALVRNKFLRHKKQGRYVWAVKELLFNQNIQGYHKL
jgi:predicted P-loop ATPase